MKTRFAAVAVALIVSLVGSLPAFASVQVGDVISYSRISGQYSGNGGEFTASVFDLSNSLLDTFQTFCIEDGQTISLGTKYEVHSVLDRSITGPTYSPDTYGVLGADKVEGATAWLFLQFWNTLYGGTVNAGFAATDYLDSILGGNSRATNAGLLQNAIWYIESNGGIGGPNSYTALANSNSAEWAAALSVVRAINPILDGSLDSVVIAGDTNASVHAQSHLVVIPTPPGGGAPVPEPMSMVVWSFLAICVAGVSRRWAA
jgi:hypothetical protein